MHIWINLELQKEGLIMKKIVLLVITITICLAIFWGCSQDTAKTDTQGEFCRVLCLEGKGIVVWIEEIGNVYIKQVDTALKIEPLDTVVMEFSADDLESASGKFTDAFGDEQAYSYILEIPKNIRHTAEGEPTFG